jgi:hypothetical protein
MLDSSWKPLTLKDLQKNQKNGGWDVRVSGESLHVNIGGFSVIYWKDGDIIRSMPQL